MNDQLTSLADHCLNGACNPLAIINGLARGCDGLNQPQIRESLAVKIIVGQLSYLLGESLGPTSETIQAYQDARFYAEA
jgi:hypothetical protein